MDVAGEATVGQVSFAVEDKTVQAVLDQGEEEEPSESG